MLKCENCESEHVVVHQHSIKGRTRYLCRNCGRTSTPAKKGRGPSIEGRHAAALIQWAQYNPVTRQYLIAIPNGGFRIYGEAKKLKAQGVKAGVSDYFLAYPMQPYAGLWIELKAPKPYKSSLSEPQKQWIEAVQKVGFDAFVAYGWVEAKDKIELYLK